MADAKLSDSKPLKEEDNPIPEGLLETKLVIADSPSPKKEKTPDSEASFSKPIRSKSIKTEIQLFLDLPSSTEEAQGTFETLEECTYTNRSIGNSRQDEAMTCDCKSDFGELTYSSGVL